MCTTPNLYRDGCLSWPCGPLPMVHKGLCTYCTTAEWIPNRWGSSRKSEWVLLLEDILKAFNALKQVCITAPILAFADFTKEFLLETNVSKEGLGAVLSQKQTGGWYHPVAYGSRAPTAHEKSYHSIKLEFLALKWAVAEHFKEYLLDEDWQ